MRSITITKNDKPLSFNEVEAVQFVGQFLELSEYEVFQLAYNDWYGKRMEDSLMGYRFENYIDEDVVPFWVWTFTKGVIKKYEKEEIDPADYGITPKILTRPEKIKGWLIVLGVAFIALLYTWAALNFSL